MSYRFRGMAATACPNVAPTQYNVNGYQFPDPVTGACAPFDSGMGVDRLVSVAGLQIRFKYLLGAGVAVAALFLFGGKR